MLEANNLIKSHKDLEVWKSSMALAEEIYLITDNFPAKETYGITAQIRRAAISIPSNIAEGAGRHSQKKFIQFLYIAFGSLAELDTQLELSQRIGYYRTHETLSGKVIRIRIMLSHLIKSLSRTQKDT